jgi:hypothetical protein
MTTIRWLVLFVLCLAIPLAFAADVKISALPAASSVSGTDELPTNQSGTTRKVTVTQLATYTITNSTSGATTTAGPVETWQVLTKDCATNATVTMATCMTTNGITAGTWAFEYQVIFQAGGTSNGVRFEIGSTMNMNPFRAQALVLATSASSNAVLSTMGKNGFAFGGWATRASANVTNNQVLSIAGVDTANSDEMAIITGSFETTGATGSLFFQSASSRAPVGVTVKADTYLRLLKLK